MSGLVNTPRGSSLVAFGRSMFGVIGYIDDDRAAMKASYRLFRPVSFDSESADSNILECTHHIRPNDRLHIFLLQFHILVIQLRRPPFYCNRLVSPQIVLTASRSVHSQRPVRQMMGVWLAVASYQLSTTNPGQSKQTLDV